MTKAEGQELERRIETLQEALNSCEERLSDVLQMLDADASTGAIYDSVEAAMHTIQCALLEVEI